MQNHKIKNANMAKFSKLNLDGESCMLIKIFWIQETELSHVKKPPGASTMVSTVCCTSATRIQFLCKVISKLFDILFEKLYYLLSETFLVGSYKKIL